MKPTHLLALALLVAASADLQAKGGRGRSHASSAHTAVSHAEPSPGLSLHGPVRAAGARSLGTAPAAAAGNPINPSNLNGLDTDLSRLDAELAAQRQAARSASASGPTVQTHAEPTPLPTAAPRDRSRTARADSRGTVVPASPQTEADLSGLPLFRAPARPESHELERDPGADYSARGVNCSAYPVRCR